MSTIKNVLETLDRDGFRPALRELDEVEGVDRERRLLAIAYARRAQHLMTNPESVAALDVAERYANRQATAQELKKARDAAWHVYAAALETAVDAAMFAAAAAAAAMYAAVHAAADVAASETEREWQIAELRRVCECIEAGTDPYPRADA